MNYIEAKSEQNSHLVNLAKSVFSECKQQDHILEPDRVREITFSPDCRVNTPDETILAQVAENIRRGLPQARPYEPNVNTAIIVAGGPSLPLTENELVEAVWHGGKVVAVNGAYQWCIDRNIKPHAFVMMDAREFNARFVETPVEGCHYLISSQCHPKAFELCRERKVTMWHSLSAGEAELALLDDYFAKIHHPVTLGTTVALRAISLMRMLGFLKMEIFGLDSCWLDDKHHAFEQKENDGEHTMPVWIRPEGRDDLAKRFICSVWMAKQAEDFLELTKDRGDLFKINVHGPGLIASMIRTGAQLEPEETDGNIGKALETERRNAGETEQAEKRRA